jgi:cell division protein FtsL
VPSVVKQERLIRLQQQAQAEGKRLKIEMNTESDKPADIYYMITVNCRYKMRIHSLLKELRSVNQLRRELDDKYALLKRDLNAVKVVKAYKPVKGD